MISCADNEMPIAIIFWEDIFDGYSTEDARCSNFETTVITTKSKKKIVMSMDNLRPILGLTDKHFFYKVPENLCNVYVCISMIVVKLRA